MVIKDYDVLSEYDKFSDEKYNSFLLRVKRHVLQEGRFYDLVLVLKYLAEIQSSKNSSKMMGH